MYGPVDVFLAIYQYGGGGTSGSRRVPRGPFGRLCRFLRRTNGVRPAGVRQGRCSYGGGGGGGLSYRRGGGRRGNSGNRTTSGN